MKIAIATVQVPFIKGGAEILAQLLKEELIKRGYEVDIVTIPFKWYNSETLLNCMLMGRMVDLTEINGEKIDKVIALKFPAFYIKHDHKVIWLLHQHRQAYDLWNTRFGDLHEFENGELLRKMIIENDNKYISESRRVFTISENTTNRLKKYNNINGPALYHPPKNYEKLYYGNLGDYIFYPSRIDEIKRQRVLVEAARYTKTDVKMYIAGGGSEKEISYLKELINKYKLQEKVKLLGFISEEEKINYYAECLGVYFGAYDEDYGYITLEAFFSRKPVIVHKDAGGPLEFVKDGHNGYVIEEDPEKLAEKIDEWMENRDLSEEMGQKGYDTLIEKNIDWDYVIKNLLE
ncbi:MULTISPECIES: glycosyltransferase family 4 protein [unclassified Clostridium]|uniref:glycosyltransferase family 4 protein n=1 Tax=unclassified Clostridium TaxID=2614128 RepID=UPI000301CC88|nr:MULTISPECIES: glycosyltransferase family 4 protein [unclassified Clostridium]